MLLSLGGLVVVSVGSVALRASSPARGGSGQTTASAAAPPSSVGASTTQAAAGSPSAAPAPASAGEAIEIANVELSWRAYRDSLVARDGARAAALVTPESIADYERQRTLALTLSRAQLLQADTVDRYSVLMYRARIPGAELRRMNGRELLQLAVARGWVASDLPSAVVVKRIVGAIAYVSFVKQGQQLPLEVAALKRVGDRWLVDLVEMMRLARPALVVTFSKIAEARGTDLNGALVFTIAQLSGAQPSDAIWEPPP